MNQQLFISEIEPNKELFQPVKNDIDIKPQGGLWTSSYIGKEGSDWIRFCFDSGVRNYNAAVSSWLITPMQNARIYTIDSYEDYEKLIKKYNFRPPFYEEMAKHIEATAQKLNMDVEFSKSSHSSTFTFIDFEKLSQDYDAMHLTYKGYKETKEPHYYSYKNNQLTLKRRNYVLLGYDCECTLWFRWCFEKIDYLGKKCYI